MNPLRGSFLVAVALTLASVGARAADLSPVERKKAKDLYDLKCAKCHKFYEPSAYTQTEWDDWMRKMSRKSKLKPAQEALLTRFLNEFREKPAPAGTK